MATTTTLGAIIDQQISDIIAITPSDLSRYFFHQPQKRMALRGWATDANQTSAAFRAFEIVPSGVAEPFPIMGPDVVGRSEETTITIAYPVKRSLYDQDGTVDLMKIARNDARQVRDAVHNSSNYVAGQHAAFVEIQPIDRDDDEVWFQELILRNIYDEATTA